MRHETVSRPGNQQSIFARRRVQIAGALIVAALLPYLFRSLVTEGGSTDPPVVNALLGNLLAVVIAAWMRLSITTYPGIRSSYVILPVALAAYAIVVFGLLLLRLPYERFALLSGFTLYVLWNYTLYFLVERRTRQRIAIVPVGAVEGLTKIGEVDWRVLKSPRLDEAAGCSAIVADFTADMPDEWEGFLADAALGGRMVYQVKQLSESLTGRVELEHLSENSFGSLVPAKAYFHLKTAADFLAAVLALPLVAPVLIIAAIAIKMEGGGPVLFKQNRVGHAGRRITVVKFRTMRIVDNPADVRAVREALATDEVDPRITRVGAFLRKTRIDELPQIWNVLKGEMSWIGPRPEPELLSIWFVSEIPFYRYRHVVKPGITGWAQVNQGYVSGVEAINRKLQYDFYYIKYFSPWLDMLILFRTIKTMLTASGR